jgi:hypothetical protein
MWDVYWVGVFLGLGVGLGVCVAGLAGGGRTATILSTTLAGAVGVGLGLVLGGIEDGVAAGLGGVLGALGTQRVLSGTLRRGGTRGAAAALLVAVGFVLVLIAFVPLAGFFEAAAVPVLAIRLRRRDPERYAGLRILARD